MAAARASRGGEPLLYEPWVLDIDTTIKPIYGRQEGAQVGYNPHKPGRPSHTYHTYWIGRLRLLTDPPRVSPEGFRFLNN